MQHHLALSALLLSAGLYATAAQAVDCTGIPEWKATDIYTGGNKAKQNNTAYQASWWTQGESPDSHSGQWEVWKNLGACDGGTVNQPPSAAITAPGAGASFSNGASIAFSATATDSDGTIAKVEFYLNGSKLGEDASAPYSLNWTGSAGSHQVYAKAYDDKSASAQSTTVNFSVQSAGNVPPTARVTAPAEGAVLATGAAVTLSAEASDSDGTIAKLEFFLDGAKLGEDLSAPYSLSWTATGSGHSLYVRASDDKGATGDSAAVAFRVGEDTADHERCRPDGLYEAPGVKTPYCTVYDENGREKMGADHPRRIIGYFTSWRTGGNGQPRYLASDIPWDRLTHINYAFAHVDGNNRVSVGAAGANNPATGMTWPGVAGAEMDPGLPYQGHFNLLSKYKRQHPQVKTLISVGGWAETGGYFGDDGQRVASGGYYTMTTNSDNSVNTAGIATFADSAVAFIRQYGFDGVDIDYEYPTSMNNAGNPDDFAIANARRAGLMRSYMALMKTLREKLDAAGATDGKHYLLTIASPSSGYLMRGMEAFQVTQYLDYINVMSYDLHGAWNQFVGPNAALYDTGEDGELKAWNYYGAAQYKNIGYLNTDWAYHYFRGAVQSGRINIGVPYYTRGWKDVVGGSNGLWGTAALPDQSKCPAGTGGSDTNKCGVGAIGIDNIWHDLDAQGREMGAGSNPLWHTKNLAEGRSGSYLAAYGLDPANDPDDRLSGSYARYYDSTAVAPWLWNAQKKVFLSIEDSESLGVKTQYVADRGLGGIMFWELAGDYRFDSVKGEYVMGSTLTGEIYERFKTAAPYGNKRANAAMPATTLDIRMSLGGFKLGDANYPINPKLKIDNQSGQTVPGGTEFSFDVPTAIPDNLGDQSGWGLKIEQSGANPGGNNIGGLVKDFHRISVKLPAYQSLASGQSAEVALNYYLPMPMPSNWVVKAGSQSFALAEEYPNLPKGTITGGGGGGGGSCAAAGIDPATVKVYPNWTAGDHANGGERMAHLSKVYKAKWWTNSVPGSDGSWEFLCSF